MCAFPSRKFPRLTGEMSRSDKRGASTLVKGAECNEADEVSVLRFCLNWRYCNSAPHPSTSLPPSPEGEGFVWNLNAINRRGELCSPDVGCLITRWHRFAILCVGKIRLLLFKFDFL